MTIDDRARTRRSDSGAARVGFVAIGRNEGERLERCLAALARLAAEWGGAGPIVYVDSGSTDGSASAARRAGAVVVDLDLSTPFTAARARNEGIRALRAIDPSLEFVQVIDGDCELIEGWMDRALGAMDARADTVVVCGRRRERYPDRTNWNRLCDMEWNTPVGDARACGGDALIRLGAFMAAGGYDDSLIAGEEPDLCYRLRKRGGRIVRLDADMTWHDADLTRFAQWWKRMVRSGHAYAEGAHRHGRGAERFNVDAVRSIIQWTVLVPLLSLALAWPTWGASLLLLLGYPALIHRIRGHRVARGDDRASALLYARYCVLGKFAQLLGVARYWSHHLRGRRSGLIEYKGSPHG